MALRLNGSTSGYVELNAPAVAGSQSLTIPNDLKSWTWDTTGTSLSGSSVTITGIPSTATQIIIGVRDLSQSDDANWSLVAGTSSGLATSGYSTKGYYLTTSAGNDLSVSSASWQTFGGAANVFEFNGTAHMTKLTGNVWYSTGDFCVATNHNNIIKWQGHVELGGTLDRVALTKSSGTFDAGTVFVHYFSP